MIATYTSLFEDDFNKYSETNALYANTAPTIIVVLME